MWNKFKEGFREGFVSVTLVNLVGVLVAIGLVYLFAWILDEPADNVVGWFALGLAASRGNR